MITVLTFADLIEVLEEIRAFIIEDELDTFIRIASVLAAFCAAWAYIKISHDYIEGQGVTFWTFLKPLVIFLLVCNFNTFVLGPVHYLTTLFTEDLSAQSVKAQDGFCRSVGKAYSSVYQEGLHAVVAEWNDHFDKEEANKDAQGQAVDTGRIEEEEPTVWQRLKRWFGGVMAVACKVSVSAKNLDNLSLTCVLFGFLNIVMHFIYYCQICLCYVYLAIYGLLGPFTFAFSILNNYSRGISDWIARYVQTAFWIPVGQVLFLICSVMMENMGKIINSDVGCIPVNPGNYLLGSFNIGSWLGIIMMCTTVVSIMAVPKICSYIIESTGTGGAAQSVGGGMQKAANWALTILK